jgi:hypothetical protein
MAGSKICKTTTTTKPDRCRDDDKTFRLGSSQTQWLTLRTNKVGCEVVEFLSLQHRVVDLVTRTRKRKKDEKE